MAYSFDVIVIGGGAAGMLAAGKCATASPDKTEQYDHQARRAADAHHGAIAVLRDQTADHKHDQPRHGYRET